MHAQPTTNVTVSSAPTVPAQAQPPQQSAPHQPKHQAPAPVEPGAAKQGRQAVFRLHTSAHEPPRTSRIFALCSWAAISIFIGLIPAGRLVAAFVLQSSILQGYAKAATSMGMLGLALITLAFASIHRGRLPWFLMTIATFLLLANVAMVYVIPL